MKNPQIDIPKLETILGGVPKGTPWFYVLYAYITATLRANNGNRTHTCRDIKMPIRSLRYKFSAMEVLGFEIPEHIYDTTKKAS